LPINDVEQVWTGKGLVEVSSIGQDNYEAQLYVNTKKHGNVILAKGDPHHLYSGDLDGLMALISQYRR
jgi:hypothetical protein